MCCVTGNSCTCKKKQKTYPITYQSWAVNHQCFDQKDSNCVANTHLQSGSTYHYYFFFCFLSLGRYWYEQLKKKKKQKKKKLKKSELLGIFSNLIGLVRWNVASARWLTGSFIRKSSLWRSYESSNFFHEGLHSRLCGRDNQSVFFTFRTTTSFIPIWYFFMENISFDEAGTFLF